MAADGDFEINKGTAQRARLTLEAHGLRPTQTQRPNRNGESLGERFLRVLLKGNKPFPTEPVSLKPEDQAEEEKPLPYPTPTGLTMFPSEKKR